jgi:hypothetical protein
MERTRDFEQRHVSTGRMEPWFQRHFPDKGTRLVAKFVVVGLLAALLGGVGGFVFDRASGATPEASRACVTDTGAPCSTSRNAKRFRNDKIRHADGYVGSLKAIYKNPRAAKKVWVRKIARELRKRHNARPATARASDYNPYPAARRLYAQNVRNANCVAKGSYPAYATGGDCTNPNPRGYTAKQVETFGSVAICGGGVALGIVTAPATAGTSVMATYGGVVCMWTFYWGLR